MENKEIKVSVVMPMYNADEYICPALDSIVNQTLKEIEIICIDDGSTDHTLDVVKKYQEEDDRIRIVTESNAGQSVARNKGIIRARGQYVAFLDADDFYESTMLEKLYLEAVRCDLDITVCEYDVYNNKRSRFEESIDGEYSRLLVAGEVISKNKYPDYIFQCMTGYVWNKLFKNSFLKEKQLTFAPELYVFEDVLFVLMAISLAERIGKCDGVLVHHRIYSSQSRPKLFRKYFAQVPVVYEKLKSYLMSCGMYVPLANSFLNVSVSRCYKIYNLLWKDAKGDFWDMLHNGYADTLAWFAFPQERYQNEEMFDFAANVGLYTHKQYLKRQELGRKPIYKNKSLVTYAKMLKNVKLREKIGAFFNKIFKKKNKTK